MTSRIAERAAMVREQLLQRSPGLLQAKLDYPPDSLLKLFEVQDPFLGYSRLPEGFVRACEKLQARLGSDAFSDFLQLLLVQMASEFDARFAASALGEAFLPEFESNLTRILDRAARPEDWRASLSDDVFLKDLGIARQVLIPCVSHLIYRHSGVPRRLLARQTLPCLIRAATYLTLRTGGVRPFLENHVHLAMVEHFNPAGRERCYGLIARLLELWPEAKGLVGGSWYYDPHVGRVTPKLAYLHDVPARKGAIFLRIGSQSDQVAGALARSQTRRRLHETGQYRPMSYLMVWSRADILRHYSGSVASA